MDNTDTPKLKHHWIFRMFMDPNMRFQAVEDIKAGQGLWWYGIVPIGLAARDIPAGTEIDYDPSKDTADIVVFESEQPDANTPKL